MSTKFNTGDFVIALNSKNCNLNPRIEGKEYKVIGVSKCPGCEAEMICIKEDHNVKGFRVRCASCGDTSMRSNHYWSLASNFRSANHFDPYEELEHALKREDYMRAAELRDMINADHTRQAQ